MQQICLLWFHSTKWGLYLCWGVLTWEGLWDDRVLHHNVRDLRLNLDSFPWQLSKDLLTEQNILGCLQLNMPCLGTCVMSKIKGNKLQPQKIRSRKKKKFKKLKTKAIQVVRKRKVLVFLSQKKPEKKKFKSPYCTGSVIIKVRYYLKSLQKFTKKSK